MITSTLTDTLVIEWLANEIIGRLRNTKPGHCARVDFLNRSEAVAICQYIGQQQPGKEVAFYILSSQQAEGDPLFISTDKAIEIRNRKLERLCLFVPSDLVDAAYSSIANSFALIDGRELHKRALKFVQEQLPPELATTVRAIFARLRGQSTTSDEFRLDFVLSLLKRLEAGQTTELGLELWRVGLIADASPTFVARLDSNRDCIINLAHPNKLGATTRERIQSLKVDATTTTGLGSFFRGRVLSDVRTWSQALAQNPLLTFDRWVFPQTEPSDLKTITIKPFLNPKGEVEAYCRLSQHDGAYGGLRARYRAKDSIKISWKTEPGLPKDLSRWHIGIVPAGSDAGFEDSLDERNIAGKQRTITIKLDMDFDEQPDFAVCVRIAPVGADGNEIIDQETNKVLFADSQEFFLVKDGLPPEVEPTKKGLRTVPNLAFGRIEAAIEMREEMLQETGVEWISKDLEYFRLRLNEQRSLNVGLSHVLLALEKRVLAEPRTGGCFTLDLDEVRPLEKNKVNAYSLQNSSSDTWAAFWRIRETFFKRLRQAEGREVIEVADWSLDLATLALRYAQTYRQLIDTLMTQNTAITELREALSIDTLFIRNTGTATEVEEAVVILPTHPLRVAWFANYTQLLRVWEQQLLERPRRERKSNVDLQALRLLVPTNTPPFIQHIATSTTFTFFQNLRFFHGVALPAQAPDPHRRYSDIATILDAGIDQTSVGDIQPDQLAEHLSHFHALHPYADTLITTLVNPDHGDFFAETMKKFLHQKTTPDDTESYQQLPTFQIISYAENTHRGTFRALEEVRQQQIDQHTGRNSDHFLPVLTTTSRARSQLELSDKSAVPEAHIAIITDFTRPIIVTASSEELQGVDTSSFSLYGLVSRFVSQFLVDTQDLLWRHRTVTDGMRKPEPHPADARFSETLIDLHTTLLNASGYLLSGLPATRPVLEVRLAAQQRQLLERLHANTNWVITLDRFFTLDYYDSPNQPGLDDLARKYVLDYSPEFTEGLGHRMMVTTAWHEEIGSLLAQAMDELGFSSIEQSVSRLLHHLKTISGRLALDALESTTNAAAAVGLAVATAWLQKNKRLRQAVLIPVDVYPRLFSMEGSGRPNRGERRCDLMLISLKNNIVEATFIEVKWRRGRTPLEELAQDMVLQMEGSAQIIKNRFFSETRVDGALQRSYLANVLRFYFERSRRYKLFDVDAETSFLKNVARLEKTGLEFRASYEGYIVSLDSEPRKQPLLIDNAKIIVLTASSFDTNTETFPSLSPLIREASSIYQAQGEEPIPQAQQEQEQGEDPLGLPPLDENFVTATETKEIIPLPTHQEEAKSVEKVPNEIVIPLGEAAGEPVVWSPGVKGSPHLFVLGIPGQGKSWTITRILSELGRQHVPSLALDFHGTFADPQGPFVQAVHPGVLDAAKGLPFSPFECTPENGQGGWMANTLAIAEIFGYVAGLGEMQQDVVFTAVRDSYKARGFSSNNDDSEQTLTYPSLAEVSKRIEQYEQARHIPNVAARCRTLLEMDLFRPMVQAQDLLTTIRNGLVIDLHNLFAETLQMAIGAFILRKIYKDMFRWGYADTLRLAIVLDEAHRLAKDVTLPKLMKEGRKFGVAVIVASQGLGDFHPDVLSNTGTKIIFRMNYPESRKVAGFIRSRQGQELPGKIEQLAVGSAYVQTSEMSYGSVVKMYPL